MFMESDALVITKIDAMGYFDFDLEKCTQRARRLNPDIRIFPVSAKTGEGMGDLEDWLVKHVEDWKGDTNERTEKQNGE